MFILFLNDMRCNTEHCSPVARAESVEDLARFLESERVEPYDDISGSQFHSGGHTYRKCFRKGGPLEWYNPPGGVCFHYREVVDVGTLELKIQLITEHWNNHILTVPAPIVPETIAIDSNLNCLINAWKENL